MSDIEGWREKMINWEREREMKREDDRVSEIESRREKMIDWEREREMKREDDKLRERKRVEERRW